ncbi:DUF2249 domain-containing protein [Pseudothauera nasutitermitis]|uniref:DUF2249 domain-containing protein n=1 Tax=Pseudothauera nasutitermitis TaxID=2565930 RepID=A0A4S4ATN0_9RHOO|nr:DUF2249 domain-containing protein [Pseudothauera nasutitermitis]THF63090.1 DUF2249 domain-containing protein [Pseudothauera nasutitermitis]
MNELPLLNDTSFPFDARGVAKRFRHAAIFGALEALMDGETMRFVNDHDPLPLLGQIRQRYGDQVSIEYISREAERVVIDFTITLSARAQPPAAEAPAPATGGGCGGGGGGCGCSGG